MNDLALSFVARWLTAKDAFAASCVSHRWQAVLSEARDNGDLWKEIFANSHPQLAKNFILEEANHYHYRRVVLGLWEGIKPKKANPYDLNLYQPTLRPHDIFAVVEIYRFNHSDGGNKRRKEVIASFQNPILCPSIVEKQFTDADTTVTLQGVNPYSQEEQNTENAKFWKQRADEVPFDYAVQDVLGRSVIPTKRGAFGNDYYNAYNDDKELMTSVTLFRRDNMKSVRVLDNDKFWYSLDDDYWQNETEEWNETGYKDGSFYHGLISKNSFNVQDPPDLAIDTDAGKSAFVLLRDYYSDCLDFRASLVLSPRLPDSGSADEPAWLRNCRQARERGETYVPSDEDKAVLAATPHFELEVESFELGLFMCKESVVRGDVEKSYVDDEDEMMLFLEALRWT